MVLNIEYGGNEVDFTKIIEAIRKADPDVVALEEAEGNTRKVAEALGTANDAPANLLWQYFSVRSQLVSKLPLIDPPGADGRYEYVEIRPGRVVALEQATRMPMLQERLDVLPDLAARGIPTFLTGDFNAPSHLDWTAATVGLRPQIKYPVPWPVSTAVEAAGFRDTYRELHPDPVADPGLTWWAGRPLIDGYPDPSEPQDRIDIIYAAGPSITDDIRIVGEAGGPQVDIAVSPWGTDHRGVVGTFIVTPGDPQPFVSVDQRLVTLGDMNLARIHTTGSADECVDVRKAGSTGDPIYDVCIGASRDATMELDSNRLGVGDYQVRLLGPGGVVLAIAPFSVVAPGTKPTLTLDATTYPSGAPITASWRDAPGSRWDWIGIYARGADPLVDSYLYYTYTGQAVIGSVVIDERGEGDWPLPPGAYDAHYLLDDGYASLSSAPFTVTK
jgi:endonuclease/exonuclease/phosphatase family metal-dependent hydrolase